MKALNTLTRVAVAYGLSIGACYAQLSFHCDLGAAYTGPVAGMPAVVTFTEENAPNPITDQRVKPLNASGTVSFNLQELQSLPFARGRSVTANIKILHWVANGVDGLFPKMAGPGTPVEIGFMNGDVTGDNLIDIADYSEMALAFDSIPGDPTWNAMADLDGNDVVDIADYTELVLNFGKTQGLRTDAANWEITYDVVGGDHGDGWANNSNYNLVHSVVDTTRSSWKVDRRSVTISPAGGFAWPNRKGPQTDPLVVTIDRQSIETAPMPGGRILNRDLPPSPSKTVVRKTPDFKPVPAEIVYGNKATNSSTWHFGFQDGRFFQEEFQRSSSYLGGGYEYYWEPATFTPQYNHVGMVLGVVDPDFPLTVAVQIDDEEAEIYTLDSWEQLEHFYFTCDFEKRVLKIKKSYYGTVHHSYSCGYDQHIVTVQCKWPDGTVATSRRTIIPHVRMDDLSEVVLSDSGESIEWAKMPWWSGSTSHPEGAVSPDDAFLGESPDQDGWLPATAQSWHCTVPTYDSVMKAKLERSKAVSHGTVAWFVVDMNNIPWPAEDVSNYFAVQFDQAKWKYRILPMTDIEMYTWDTWGPNGYGGRTATTAKVKVPLGMCPTIYYYKVNRP